MTMTCAIGASFLHRLKKVYVDVSWMYQDGDDSYSLVQMECVNAGDSSTVQHLRGFFCIEVICHRLYMHAAAEAYRDILMFPVVEEALEERSWLSLTRLHTQLEESIMDVSSLLAELDSMPSMRKTSMQVHKMALPYMIEAIKHCREAIVLLRRSLRKPRSIGRIGDLLCWSLLALNTDYGEALNICRNMFQITEGNAVRGWQIQKLSRKEYRAFPST